MSRRRFLKLFASGAIGVGAASVLGVDRMRSLTGWQSAGNPCPGGGDQNGGGPGVSGGGDYGMPNSEPEDFEGEVIRGESLQRDAGSEGFHLKNVAVIQDTPRDYHGGERALAATVRDPDGVGIVENCYFEGEKANNGIFVHPDKHEGTLVFRNCYITRFGSDALYAETSEPHGQGGQIVVENCYFRDNNIAHVRISKGEVRGTVVHNTENVPANADGVVHSRGLSTQYAGSDTVLAENVHVEVTDANTNGASKAVNIVQEGSDWEIRDSEIQGMRDDRGKATYPGTGENPDIRIPEGVPGSPEDI